MDEEWDEAKRRQLIAEAMELYRWRGTVKGLKRYRWGLAKGAARPPIADAGPDRTASTLVDEATMALDASGSRASGGRTVERCHWS